MTESSDRELLDLIRRSGPLTVRRNGRATRRDRHRDSQSAGATPGIGAGGAPHRAPGSWATPAHVSGERRSPEAAGPELHRPGAGALGRDDELVADRKLRRLLFTRVTDRLAEIYRSQVSGHEWEGRLVQLTSVLHDRGIEAEVARDAGAAIPILRQHSCPYYELAEADRAICALERKMFEKVLGRELAAQSVPARRRSFL